MARKACALRASHDCLHPCLRRPLERGSTKRRRKSQDKGAQLGAGERAKTKGLNLAQEREPRQRDSTWRRRESQDKGTQPGAEKRLNQAKERGSTKRRKGTRRHRKGYLSELGFISVLERCSVFLCAASPSLSGEGPGERCKRPWRTRRAKA